MLFTVFALLLFSTQFCGPTLALTPDAIEQQAKLANFTEQEKQLLLRVHNS